MTASIQSPPRVGVIGLGQMGRGIARNLASAGLLSAVWDISPPALVPFNDAPESLVAASPRALAETCDIVIFVVPSSKEIEMCLDGTDGVLAAVSDDQVLVDLTTSHPDDTRKLATKAQEGERAYLDAGMSGGAQAADDGQLALMFGGDAVAFARLTPALEAIANMDKVFHVGPSGAGHTMKLVHNMICHTIFMATAEGCRVAEKSGIDLTTAINVINNGNARSFVSEFRFPRHILSGNWDARSRVANLQKDLGMGVAMANSLGAPAAFSAETLALLNRALDAGMSEIDFSRLYQEFDRLAE
ncbi:MAG: NAD(P)-dependent oxidoreductase [Hyphomicrobiaceae bacterium]